MVLTELMMMTLFLLEFYLNLGYQVRYTPKSLKLFSPKLSAGEFNIGKKRFQSHCKIANLLLVDSMINLTSQRGEISYKIILKGYVRGSITRSDSRLFPPMLVHGSRPSCFEHQKLSHLKIGP
ncbi:hypothetical protein AMTRI_Chr02g218890 [Amborella trichopoda]